MRTGGASSDHGDVWSFKTVLDRDIAGNHIDHHARYEKRRHSSRPTFLQRAVGTFDGVDPADTRTDRNADAIGIAWVRL